MDRRVALAVAALTVLVAGCATTNVYEIVVSDAGDAAADIAVTPESGDGSSTDATGDVAVLDAGSAEADGGAGKEASAPDAGNGDAQPDASADASFLGCVVSSCDLCPNPGSNGSCVFVCDEFYNVDWANGRCDPEQPQYTGTDCATGESCSVTSATPGGTAGVCYGTCG